MEATQVRLELIKLVYGHNGVKTAISDAEVLEEYVLKDKNLKSNQTTVDEHMDLEVKIEGKPEVKASRSIYKKGNP